MGKKIVFVIRHFMNGGAQHRTLNLASALCSEGYDVTILVLQEIADVNMYQYNDNICIKSLPAFFSQEVVETAKNKNRLLIQKKRKKIKRFSKGLEFFSRDISSLKRKLFVLDDTLMLQTFFSMHQKSVIIVIANIFDYEKVVYAAEGFHCKIIFAEISSPLTPLSLDKQKQREIIVKSLNKAKACVFQTYGTLEYYKAFAPKKCYVIRNPVCVQYKESFVGEREKSIVNFCRFDPLKNLKLLIDSFELLLHSHPEYKLLIYGIALLDSDLEHKQEIMQYIKNRKLNDKVHILSPVMDIHSKIVKCAMYVSSSNFEGLSNSMLEAMALGLPCVCTDCFGGSAREMIQDGENGLLVPVNDPEAMCRAMKRMIEEPELAKKCGENASKIRQELSVERIINQWIEVIKSI